MYIYFVRESNRILLMLEVTTSVLKANKMWATVKIYLIITLEIYTRILLCVYG